MIIIKKVLIFPFILSLPLSLLYGAFDQFLSGARPAGMADAFVAVADDSNASAYNPAGLSQLRSMALFSDLSRTTQKLDDGAGSNSSRFGFTSPIKNGDWGAVTLMRSQYKGGALVEENLTQCGYGFRAVSNLSLGANIKVMERRYSHSPYFDQAINNSGNSTGQADPLFKTNGNAKKVNAIDIGLMGSTHHYGHLRYGIVFNNINHPDISLGQDREDLSTVRKAGVSFLKGKTLLAGELRSLRRLQSQRDVETALGLEHSIDTSLFEKLSFRLGWAGGSREFKMATGGISFQFINLILDYALQIPVNSHETTPGHHMVSLTYTFSTSADKKNALTRNENYDAKKQLDFLTKYTQAHPIPIEEFTFLVSLLSVPHQLNHQNVKWVGAKSIEEERLIETIIVCYQLKRWREAEAHITTLLQSPTKRNFHAALALIVYAAHPEENANKIDQINQVVF